MKGWLCYFCNEFIEEVEPTVEVRAVDPSGNIVGFSYIKFCAGCAYAVIQTWVQTRAREGIDVTEAEQTKVLREI